MKKPKLNITEIELTQMEIDLSKHLKERLYQTLGDFRDTAEIADMHQRKSMAIMIATLLDAAITGLLATGIDQASIDAVMKYRLKLSREKQREARQ